MGIVQGHRDLQQTSLNPTRDLNTSTSETKRTGQRNPLPLLVSCRKKKDQGALDGKPIMT
jgi:hypothetical protein